MNSEKKLIVDKRISFWLAPFRYFYRMLAKCLPNDVMLKQMSFRGNEILLWAQEDIGKRLILTGSFEQDEICYIERNVRVSDICFDVGGNTGIYAMLFAKLTGARGKVYVFEPIRKNVLAIELASEINGFKNVQVFEGVASNENGVVMISTPEMDGAYTHIEKYNISSGMHEVRSITLDSFMANEDIKKIDILKVDVEGAEFEVLRGAKNILSNENVAPRLVMVELFSQFLEKFDASIPDILNYMNSFSYKPYYVQSDGSLVTYTNDDHDKVFNVFFLRS